MPLAERPSPLEPIQKLMEGATVLKPVLGMEVCAGRSTCIVVYRQPRMHSCMHTFLPVPLSAWLGMEAVLIARTLWQTVSTQIESVGPA